MSYEILYGRQFIDLQNGTYIPLILHGSNNCTMFRNGREVLERHWSPLGPNHLSVAATHEDLMGWIGSCVRENPKGEWFMRSGKWILGEDMIGWMESGIKSALPLDDISRRAGSLRCSVHIYDSSIPYGEKGHCKEEGLEYVRTTEELLKWITLYEEAKKSATTTQTVYPVLEFLTDKPLGLGKKPKPNSPVVCKIRNGYLTDYNVERCGYTYCPDASKAIVFASEDDFREKTSGLIKQKYRLIAPPDNKPKLFVIAVASGCYNGEYVEKLSRSRLHLCRSAQYARSFAYEKEAQKYIDEKLAGRFTNCKDFAVVKREELAKGGV